MDGPTIEGHRPTIALAAGGTGGHMFPAEAMAEEMKRRGWKVLLFTDQRGMRYADGFPANEIVTLDADNPNVRGVVAKARVAVGMAGAIAASMIAFRKHKPNVAVGFGGYPSAPAMLAARLSGVPHGVHEQNAVLGRVNRMVARTADFVAHAFPKLERLPTGLKAEIIETGNPVRDAIRAVEGQGYHAPIGDAPIEILVFGGSQGAALFSRVVPPALAGLPENVRRRLNVTQQVREEEKDEVRATYQGAGIACELQPFFRDIPQRLTDAHVVVARAGASSVTELATVGRPAILVPLGIAMDDHQTGNAQVLVEAGAAELIAEPDFSAERLSTVLEPLLTDSARLSQMAVSAASVAPHGAVTKLADYLEGRAL